ncbi:Fpg/Nei family DNA glycosylase [Acidipila sp. EB88]|uniref:Fpg/Nei family DNA glycosylase n=1 Tax=Acidipila sp. EB88 TaxID=2305226 RepID=UPI000F5DB7BD|nr:DNA-formamidopyrimidine glycosylase family protein [Acidipila sp. EB88]RRA48750.1 Fpg/Nei family DNA glycosylase [Acidipila sp. EB88]
MPEGDTIYRSARALSRALTGKVVTAFETALAPLASVDDNTPVHGRTVENIEANGKWLLIYFSGDLILVTHMLMSGSWHIYRVGERWRVPRRGMRCVIRVEDFEAVAFNVPVAKFFTARTLERNSMIPRLGPDLLRADYDEQEARKRILARPDEEIASVLLNQQVIAGLGNVYKCEVPFLCGVHPFRKVSSITEKELDDLLYQSRRLIGLNVQEESEDKILTYTGARRTTNSSSQAARLWVYGRQGQPCRRCGTAVLMRKQGPDARSTYWCPQCQPGDALVQGWAMTSGRKRVGC